MTATVKLTLESFAAEFLSLSRERRTGTYRVAGADGRTRLLLFREGSIIDLDTGEEDSVLTAAALAAGEVGDRDLKRFRKVAAKSGRPLGAVILEEVVIPEERLVASILSTLSAAIGELFTAELSEAAFIAHAADERLEGFSSELSDVLEINADPEEIFLQAARRLGRWDLVEQNFHLLAHVHYATPAASRYFKDADASREQALLGLIDGRRDFGEVIRQAASSPGAELDSFEALSLVRTMAARGEVEPLNPVQLFQLGVEYQRQKDLPKALRLFARAAELGLDDFDLSYKIAEALDGVGRRGEAAAKYQDFAEKCLTQFRPDEAIASYRKACALEPGNLTWGRKLLELYIQEHKGPEAVEQGLKLAEAFGKSEDARGGLNVLLDLRRRGFKDDRLGQAILELAEEVGDESSIRSERERMANDFCERKDVEKAISLYQKLFSEGNTSLEVRLKLVDLHHQKGNAQQALDHAQGILSQPEAERPRDPAVLRRLHELVCQLKPGDARAHRWLVDHHYRSGNREEAKNLLRRLATHHEKTGDAHEQLRVLRQLLAIDPDQPETRLRMAKALEKAGKRSEAIEALGETFRSAIAAKKSKEAIEAIEECLRLGPFHAEARRSLAGLLIERGEKARATALYRDAAHLYRIGGDAVSEEGCWRSLLGIESESLEALERVASAPRGAADAAKAAPDHLRLAAVHRAAGNLGSARRAVEAALQLSPRSGEAQALLRELEALERGTAPGDRPEAAPAAPRSAAPAVTTPAPAPAAIPVAERAAAPAAPPPAPLPAAGTETPFAASIEISPPASLNPANSVPAPSPSAAPAPDGHEPFQQSGPVVQKSVAGITARLRGMKSGGGPGSGSAGPGSTAPAPGADSGAPAAPANPGEAVSAVKAKGAALGSAASRLKALASGGGKSGGAGTPIEASAPAAASTAADSPPADSTPPAAPITPDAAELEQLRTRLQGKGSAETAPRPASGTRSLGKSAAILSKLRKVAGPSELEKEKT